MTISKTLIATGLTAVLVGAAPSAFAQHRGGGDRGRAPAGRVYGRSDSRAGGRVYSGGRVYGGRAIVVPRGGYYRGYSHVAPLRFYRPYYSFRPRLSLGFGMWAGYPLAYSYPYYDPYLAPYNAPAYAYPSYEPEYAPYPPSTYPQGSYPQSSPYPQGSRYPQGSPYPQGSTYPQGSADPRNMPPAQNSVGVQGIQPQANTGGVSFEITPADAEVIVDGEAIGSAGQFTPTSQPLGLPAGRHQIELSAPGYRTMSFDVDIVAGQVIPYQGTLTR